MDVPQMYGVDAGLAATSAGGGLLLLVAVWWSWTGDGIRVPRERWPALVRLTAAAGWLLFAGGLFVQLAAYVAQVGATRW